MEGYVVTGVSGMDAVETVTVQQGDKVRRLSIDALFVDMGLIPNSTALRGAVETDDEGFVKVDGRNATSLPGVFAAGDVTTVYGEHALLTSALLDRLAGSARSAAA